MTGTGPHIRIDLQALTTETPFVLVVDGSMELEWVSAAVHNRRPVTSRDSAHRVIALTEPEIELRPETIRDRLSATSRAILRGTTQEIPLAGRWLEEEGRFVFLGSLDIPATETLESISFEDFGANSVLIDLLTTRDELDASLADAHAAIEALKETNEKIEASRFRYEHANTCLQNEIEIRRRIEAAMRSAADFQRKVLSTAATAIFTVDDQRCITTVNEELCQITGYSEEELIGRDCSILRGGDCAGNCDLFGRSDPVKVSRKKCVFRSRDGKTITVLKNADLVTSAAGCVTGGVESFVDVTHLIEACEKAEEAARAKSDFLANMSHELRTPMNGIIGMTDLALATELKPEQREYLDMARGSAGSLLRLLDDILDFSKIEAGKLEFERIGFSLRRSVGRVLKLLGVRTHEKGLELVCRIGRDTPDALVGDPERLSQVIINLIGNSIKFTDEGEVFLDIDLEECPEGGGERESVALHFTVTDTGIGIPLEKQSEIFEEFSQADGSMTRRYGGTGLGLSISSRLVQMMGGRIWIKSEPGQGSTFHFTARFETGERELMRPMTENTETLAGMRVLVVDDSGASRSALEEMLLGWKMIPTLAGSGQEALAALWSTGDSAGTYDLILIDSLMPEMDGFTLAERVRQDREFSDLRIVMLTSPGEASQGERCRGLGINGTLTKPIVGPELLEIVLGGGPESSAGEDPGTDASAEGECPAGLRILLAEDNPVNQCLAIHLLEKSNTILVANNGSEAVETFDREQIDIILMDVQMPVLNGLEATAAIRERERVRGGRVPILAMTANAMKGDDTMCLEAGMDGYVAKPIKRNELFGEMRRLVAASDCQQTAAAGGTTADSGPADSVAGPADSAAAAAEAVYDRAAAVEQVDGDEEFLSELAGIFLENCPELIAEVEEAFATGDAELLQRAAHTIKGSVATFCAAPAREAAQNLEMIAREGKLDEAPEAYRRLEERLAELSPVLESLAAEIAAG